MNLRHAILFALVLGGVPVLRGQDASPGQMMQAALERIAELERRLAALEQARPQAAAVTPVAGLAPDGGTHLVLEGETMRGIAQQSQIPVEALEKANHLLPGAVVRPGDHLVIPAQAAETSAPPIAKDPVGKPDSSGWTAVHTIRDGETLSSIARLHQTNSIELARRNGIEDANLIRAGQELRVPGASKPEAAVASVPSSVPASASAAAPQAEETYHFYSVEQGDTLVSVAALFFSTPDQIARLNEIESTAVLKVGQQLLVPTSRYFKEKRNQGRAS
jgi:LysM repeat protein